jgi:hypothetical protein
MTVYCNITDCTNWLPLKEPKQMEHKPGFRPLGKTDYYDGQCSFKSIEIQSTTAKSQHTKQVLAICGSYNADEPKQFKCFEERCKYFIDPTTCSKLKYDENLYIDWTIAFDGLDRKAVPRCKTFAHRWRENAFDWGRAAMPNI